MKMWFCFLEKTVSHGEAQGIEAKCFRILPFLPPGKKIQADSPVFCGVLRRKKCVQIHKFYRVGILAQKLEPHFTPKHGSWLDIAEEPEAKGGGLAIHYGGRPQQTQTALPANH
jgi:hypothetical protein